MTRNILVTGGNGYLGSHLTLCLARLRYRVLVLDNLSTSTLANHKRVKDRVPDPSLVQLSTVDLTDYEGLCSLLSTHQIDCCIHLALRLPSESHSSLDETAFHTCSQNMTNTLSLIRALQRVGCRNLIIRSTYRVYGNETPPYRPETLTGIGIDKGVKSFHYLEDMMNDLAHSGDWSIASLRAPEVAGCCPDLRISQDNHRSDNLIRRILYVASGKRGSVLLRRPPKHPNTAGEDFTINREYLHVGDLAEAFVAALIHLTPGFTTHLIGTGVPLSDHTILNCARRLTGHPIPSRSEEYWVVSSRYSDASHSLNNIGWCSEHTVERLLEEEWEQQTRI